QAASRLIRCERTDDGRRRFRLLVRIGFASRVCQLLMKGHRIMNDQRIHLTKHGLRAGLAVLAAVLLVGGGATWRNLVAEAQSSQTKAESSASSAVTRALPGGRDSYADIVNVVAPAVVTVRVEGKASASPTQFDGDDLFRRFFGEQPNRE